MFDLWHDHAPITLEKHCPGPETTMVTVQFATVVTYRFFPPLSFEHYRVASEQLQFVHFLLWERHHRVVVTDCVIDNKPVGLCFRTQDSSGQVISAKAECVTQRKRSYQNPLKNITYLTNSHDNWWLEATGLLTVGLVPWYLPFYLVSTYTLTRKLSWPRWRSGLRDTCRV